jgi:hypothetical protein
MERYGEVGTHYELATDHTPWPLYLRRKSHRYPLEKSVDGVSGRCEEETELLHLLWFLSLPTRNIVTKLS